MTSEELDLLRPLDESLYALEADDTRFLGEQTGMHDAEELKQHVLKVQADIYAVSATPHRSKSTLTLQGRNI